MSGTQFLKRMSNMSIENSFVLVLLHSNRTLPIFKVSACASTQICNLDAQVASEFTSNPLATQNRSDSNHCDCNCDFYLICSTDLEAILAAISLAVCDFKSLQFRCAIWASKICKVFLLWLFRAVGSVTIGSVCSQVAGVATCPRLTNRSSAIQKCKSDT